MKCNLITAAFLVIQLACAAQYDNANRKDSLKVLNAKYIFYDLKTDKNVIAKTQLPFNKIVFKDVRYDTSFTAINWLWKNAIFSSTFSRKYNFNGGLATSLSNYFNNYYSTLNTDSSNILICYIKKFSVTIKNELLEHFNEENQFQNKADNDINIEIECYYKAGDSLYPATRVDTAYSYRFQNGETDFTDAVKKIIEPLMHKTEHINLNTVIKRNSYTLNEIEKRYTARFNIPVLTSNTYKKGIYKNFAEFRNNAPSIDSFTVSTDKLKVNAANVNLIDATSLLYKAAQKRNTTVFLYDKNNELISPSEVFGYCDGETIWIQHGAFFYPLVKTGNSFEFIYIYHYADGNQRTQTVYILLPLNMETGHSN